MSEEQANAVASKDVAQGGHQGERAREILAGLLERMAIPAEVVVTDGEDRVVLEVQCSAEDDLQRVIGRRGQVVDALQHLVGKMLVKSRGEARGEGRGKPIVVDAGGYRQRHIERLEGLAARMAEKAQASGQPVELSPMPAYDRRIIHMALAEVEGVETRSEGEGDLRHVVVVPS